MDKYFVSFIAVTKPATAGEVKAAMTVTSKSSLATMLLRSLYYSLPVYDASGLKYTIVRYGGDGTTIAFMQANLIVLPATRTTCSPIIRMAADFEGIVYDTVHTGSLKQSGPMR